jgi:hypothetical protein
MCCIFTTLVFLGPRMALFVWWLLSPARFDHAFNTWYWPILGFIFVPFTTLMYVAVRPGGVVGFDWVWLGLSLFIDISVYAGGGYGNRNRVPRFSEAQYA